jgi:hypothetical protein
MSDETPKKHFRFRYVYMGLGTFLTMILFLLSDPTGGGGPLQGLPFGAGVLATVILSLWVIFYIALLHLSRKALMDYVHLSDYFRRALATPEGAGMAIIGVGLFTLSIAVIISAVILSGSARGF